MSLPADYQTSEYGSHWWLITQVMEHFNPKRILETGSGRYSTNLFLTFPIDELVSIENDPRWQIDTEDDRHTVLKVEGPAVNHVPLPLDYDLVFVDDDPVSDRVVTIQQALAHATGLVVIHDTDYEPYHALVRDMPNFTDTTRKPHTSVLHPAPNKEFDRWLATS